MASPSLNPEREEERRLNVRTLAIASAASATAAAVTSQLWIAGTWIAAAITPVMVALLSEILRRPAEKLARPRTSDRPALDPPPARRSSERPGAPGEAPIRIYRQPSSSQAPKRARIAVRVVVVTGALAFGIAVVTITAGELLAGGSIGDGARKTTFGGGAKNNDRDTQPTDTERDRPVTEPDEPTRTQPTTTEEEEPAPAEPPVTEPPSSPEPAEPTDPEAPSAQPPAQTTPAP